jgi:hypothetical protein
MIYAVVYRFPSALGMTRSWELLAMLKLAQADGLCLSLVAAEAHLIAA